MSVVESTEQIVSSEPDTRSKNALKIPLRILRLGSMFGMGLALACSTPEAKPAVPTPTVTAVQPGICSPDLAQSFHPLVTSNMRDLNPDTSDAIVDYAVRSLEPVPGALMIGYGGHFPDVVAAVTYQGVEWCGSASMHLGGHVNDITYNPQTGETLVVTDRVQQTDRFGTYVLNPKTKNWTQLLPPGLPADQGYNASCTGLDCLISTYGGVIKWSNDRLYPVSVPNVLPNPDDSRTTAALLLNGGSKVIGRMSLGVGISDNTGTWTNLEGLPLNIRDARLDPSGSNLWVAADGGVAHKNLKTDEITKEYLPTDGAIRVRFDPDGDPWVTTYNKGREGGGVYFLNMSHGKTNWQTIIAGNQDFNDVSFGSESTFPGPGQIAIATGNSGILIRPEPQK